MPDDFAKASMRNGLHDNIRNAAHRRCNECLDRAAIRLRLVSDE